MTNSTKFIYLPVYLSDYVSEARKLTMLQRGALIDLSCLYFQENLKLEYSKDQIYRMVFAFEQAEKDAVDFILKNYFTESENKPMGFYWVSNTLNQIGDKVLKRLEANRNNGKKGGRGNKKENKPIGSEVGNPNDNPNESILNESKLNQIKEKEIIPKPKGFIPPTLEKVKNYCQERQNDVDANKFLNFYESKGWMVGKSKMKDWKASVRTWEKPKDQEASKFAQYQHLKPTKTDHNKEILRQFINETGGKDE